MYVDAAHGREPHQTASGFCKSRSGAMITAGGATIAAISSVQGATATSTFEAELYALALGVRVLLAIRKIYSFITGFTLPASRVHCDNQSVIAQLERRDLSGRTRHIRIHLGFIFDAIDDSSIAVYFVRSNDNPADAFTATEAPDRFKANVDAMLGNE